MELTGVPRQNGKQHASEIAKMAFDLVRRLRHLEIPHLPGIKFTLRIGCHSGKAVLDRLIIFSLVVSVRAVGLDLTMPSVCITLCFISVTI